MRVLHVITALSGGGAERFVASLTPALSEHLTRCGVLVVNPVAIPGPLAHAAKLDVLEINRRGRYDASFLGRMISAMRAWRPDVVHTHMFHGTYWGRVAALAAGAPAIVRTEHLPCDPQARVRGTAFADRILNSATAAIVTFFPEQGRFLARYEHFAEAKLAIIPNGIVHAPAPTRAQALEARRGLRADADAFVIVVLGNLHRHKNQTLAIDAVAELDAAHRRRVRLYFLGDGIDRPKLMSHVNERALREHVVFLGFRNDVAQLLPAADLLLMPSLSEGMPLALLEAMSAGVPALSTPWRGVRDMLRGGELGTIADDFAPTTIARSIRAIMDDPERARQTARKAQAVARVDYDIARTAARHVRLYESLVRRLSAA